MWNSVLIVNRRDTERKTINAHKPNNEMRSTNLVAALFFVFPVVEA